MEHLIRELSQAVNLNDIMPAFIIAGYLFVIALSGFILTSFLLLT